jgi:hypothetical protein
MKRRDVLRLALATGGAHALGIATADRAAAMLMDLDASLTLGGLVRSAGLTVPPGHILRFDPAKDTTLELRGNLVVQGTLEMKPEPSVTHTIRFVGIDESRFVGGGMSVLTSDVGLWVIGRGRLQIEGTERAGWGRSGMDPSWLAGDEILTTPFDQGDVTTFAPYAGQLASLQGPDGQVHTQEVFNLTRNVRIEGTPTGRTHIMIMSAVPQVLRSAAVRYVGPRKDDAPILGRYGVHFHLNGDRSRGSKVDGVVVRDSGSYAFVPHTSHGISFRDCVAFSVAETAFWWDPGDRTDDVLWRHCLAVGMTGGRAPGGFLLGTGAGNRCIGCVSVGNTKGHVAPGFFWPAQGAEDAPSVWEVHRATAHNNRGIGMRIWKNSSVPSTVSSFVGFRNGTGLMHGAYRNAFVFRGCQGFQNDVDLVVRALSKEPPDAAAGYEGCAFGTVRVGEHVIGSNTPVRFEDGPVGSVTVDEARRGVAGRYDFVRCGLSPDDWTVTKMHRDSVFRVQQEDGVAYVVNPDGSTSPVPPFAA